MQPMSGWDPLPKLPIAHCGFLGFNTEHNAHGATTNHTTNNNNTTHTSLALAAFGSWGAFGVKSSAARAVPLLSAAVLCHKLARQEAPCEPAAPVSHCTAVILAVYCKPYA